ncbi:MAG: DUF6323 family protein [Fusicatenibacter sp.]|nr:DUF6323 family protein [Fusicatenibacter sp.]
MEEKKDIFDLISTAAREKDVQQLMECNRTTEKYGIVLSVEDARMLSESRIEAQKKHRRVEFGEGILPEILRMFCDSPYIQADDFVQTAAELQDLFFQYKNEAAEQLTDAELLNFMREQFDRVCYGSLELLGGTCLERFARAIREGYSGYEVSEGCGEYDQFSEEEGWNSELYYEILHELLG